MASASPAPLTMVVLSLSMVTFSAVPSMSMVVFSSVNPRSSEITVPPVRIAISSSMALRRSPKPGALTAAIFNVPLSLLTTKVAKASPSTSSATTTRGLPVCATGSKTGKRSFIVEIFLSNNNIYGVSRSASIFSEFVTK